MEINYLKNSGGSGNNQIKTIEIQNFSFNNEYFNEIATNAIRYDWGNGFVHVTVFAVVNFTGKKITNLDLRTIDLWEYDNNEIFNSLFNVDNSVQNLTINNQGYSSIPTVGKFVFSGFDVDMRICDMIISADTGYTCMIDLSDENVVNDFNTIVTQQGSIGMISLELFAYYK